MTTCVALKSDASSVDTSNMHALLDSLKDHGVEPNSPFAHFLLDVYTKLQDGQKLTDVLGEKETETKSESEEADTVRSLSPSGKLNFPNLSRTFFDITFKKLKMCPHNFLTITYYVMFNDSVSASLSMLAYLRFRFFFG